MQKIQSVSTLLYGIFILLFWFTPVVYLLYWLEPTHAWLNVLNWNISEVDSTTLLFSQLPLHIRLMAWVVTWMPMTVHLFIWYFLIQLFKAYRQGIIFASRNARMIRNIGVTLLIWEVVTLPYQLLMTFVISSTQPAGQHFIAVSYSTHDLSNILAAAIIIVIGLIMQRAADLSEEQALTV